MLAQTEARPTAQLSPKQIDKLQNELAGVSYGDVTLRVERGKVVLISVTRTSRMIDDSAPTVTRTEAQG